MATIDQYNNAMSASILKTKLYIPPSHSDLVQRTRLFAKITQGAHGKITLVSAPAGSGKTTLISEWLHTSDKPTAWLSLDEHDSDAIRFLTYLIITLQGIAPEIGNGILEALQSAQPPPVETFLTPLVNQLASVATPFILVLDDYHMLDSTEVDSALVFLIEHQPPQMHLIMTTREDPNLPLARLRARRQLTEIRAADLRFTPEEASTFINEVMGLSLSPEAMDALEKRTEGWIAGLQLAAISMQGHQDRRQFIEAFTGSHHFVLDYLVEEVLSRQPADLLDFLIQTSMLDRMCGPLCDAIFEQAAPVSQSILEQIHQSNLFLIPLDDERRWYRYHHLFGDLLRKRLHQAENVDVMRLHHNASLWFEDNAFELEAFQHAADAGDINRMIHLVERGHTPLYLRGYAVTVLSWLRSLASETRDNRPILWVMTAWVLWITHQSPKVEPILQKAEVALAQRPPDDETDLTLGRIAAMRAMLAANTYQTDVMIAQSERALALLPDDQQYVRLEVKRTLASAHHIIGNRDEAVQAYLDTITLCEATNNVFTNILATTGLGIVYELETQLNLAEHAYGQVLTQVGEPLQPIACEACLGLARIAYERNDLDAAAHYGEQAIFLAEQIEGIDTALAAEVLMARVTL
ncbi:MAG: AAA family ATPase, partial [Chloroflexota bacterium]